MKLPLSTLIVVLILLSISPYAAAHGILQGSSPRTNAVLAAPPPEVVLAFSEPVDATFSRVIVLDSSGRSVGPAAEVAGGGRRMRVVLPSLQPGAFTVRWRVMSALDGHVSSGAFVFAVGAGEQLQGPVERGLTPPPVQVAFRWLMLVAALLLAGTVAFQALILRPVLRRVVPEQALEVGEEVVPSLERLRVVSGLVFLVALGLEFTAQSAVLVGGAAGLAHRTVLSPLLLETRSGWSLFVRAFATAVLLVPASPPWRILRAAAMVWFVVVSAVIIVLGGPSALQGDHVIAIVLVGTVYGLASIMAARILPSIRDVRIPEWRWVRPAAAAILLAGFTLTSHAIAAGLWAAAVDWLHLAAAAVWVGGLPSLLVVFRTVPGPIRAAVAPLLVPRVSQVAGVTLGMMIVTGLLAAVRDVGSLRALAASLYGRTLLVKVGLVVLVLALGAVNRFVFRPRIASGRNGPALEGFRRSVMAEVALGAAILLAVAVLTITPPAAVTNPSATGSAVVLAGIAGDLRVRLEIAPAEPGWNDVQAAVTDDGGTVVRSATVQVVLHAMGHPEDRAFGLLPVAGGYAASGDFLAPGWWEVRVIVRRGGQARDTTFPLIVGKLAGAGQFEALRLLDRVRTQMQSYRSWREIEQITDGSGHVVRTVFETVRPDRLRYTTSGRSQAVILGATRFGREGGGPWVRDQLPQPLSLTGPYTTYLENPERVRLGREEPCADETCRVLLWELQGGTASFAARVGLRTYRIHSLAMVAPEHFMVSQLRDLNAPIQITPP